MTRKNEKIMKKIIVYCKDEALNRFDIAWLLSMSPNTVSLYVNQAVSLGFIAPTTRGIADKKTYYVATQKGKEWANNTGG